MALSIDIAAAVNRRDVLANCLGRSPDIAEGAARLRTYEGFSTAGAAYNAALDESDAEVLVLVHQDVYLPRGFLANLRARLAELESLDPNWAVAGVIGLDENSRLRGQTWSSGLGKLVGEAVETPALVATLDEVILIVNRRAGLLFDPELPSFHLYAADIVLSARARGLRAYAIHAPIVHHSRPVVGLDAGYKRAYRYMQRKWRAVLPVPNLVCPLKRSPLPMLIWDLRTRWLHRGKPRAGDPTDSPADVARRLGFEG